MLGAFLAVDVVVAVASGSLVLLSDAAHMLSDVGAICEHYRRAATVAG